MEGLHFSESPSSDSYHINRLVEMLIDFHTFLVGDSNSLVNHSLEFPVPGITKRI